MDRLTNCPACGHKIAQQRFMSCPNCGGKFEEKDPDLGFLLVLGVLFSLIIGAFWLVSKVIGQDLGPENPTYTLVGICGAALVSLIITIKGTC